MNELLQKAHVEIKAIREQHPDDDGVWTVLAIEYLEKTYRSRLSSSRVLVGQMATSQIDSTLVVSDHEEYLGDFLAITEGVVFFRGAASSYEMYGGLVRRTRADSALLYRVMNVADPSSTLEIVGSQGGSARVTHADAFGSSTDAIDAVRWLELKTWLERWLPEID